MHYDISALDKVIYATKNGELGCCAILNDIEKNAHQCVKMTIKVGKSYIKKEQAATCSFF